MREVEVADLRGVVACSTLDPDPECTHAFTVAAGASATAAGAHAASAAAKASAHTLRAASARPRNRVRMSFLIR